MTLKLLNFAVLLLLLLLPVGTVYAQTHANVIENVAKATPTIALLTPSVRIVNIGQAFTWQASVQGVPVAAPTGNVLISAKADIAGNSLSSGFLPLAQPLNSGVLHPNPWIMQAPAPGIYIAQAVYPGDSNYNSAVSAPLQVAVLGPADFAVGVPSSITVKQGQSFSPTVTVSSINNFTGVVNLTCAGLAPLMQCSPKLKSLALSLPVSAYQQLQATPASATAKLEITTTATSVSTVTSGLLLFLYFGDLRKKRSKKRQSTILLALLGSLLVLAGCGGGVRYLQSNGTPRGTYKISITGTSGNIIHTQVVSVTII